MALKNQGIAHMEINKAKGWNNCFFLLLLLSFLNPSSGCAQTGKSVSNQTPRSAAATPNKVDAWKPFSSVEGRFAVLLPGTPTETTQLSATPFGQLTIHNYDISSGAAFHISYIDYPESIRDVKAFFAGVRDGGLKQINGTLLAERAVYIREGPGWDYQARSGNKYVVWVRCLLIRRRFYQLSVAFQEQDGSATDKRSEEEMVTKFLTSFKPVPVRPRQPAIFGDPAKGPGLPRQSNIEVDPALKSRQSPRQDKQ